MDYTGTSREAQHLVVIVHGVTAEIEEEIEKLARDGQQITRLSVVGYSLGGLVARYSVGLLESKGFFERIKPVGYGTAIVGNTRGSRIDLLEGPRKIRKKDVICEYRQRSKHPGISSTDPFVNPDKIKINYLKGYEDVILDPKNPVSPLDKTTDSSISTRFMTGTQKTFGNLPLILAMVFFIPFGVVAFLVNSAIQSLRSKRRIRLYEQGLAGIQPQNYRVPLLITGMREAVEDVYENLNSAQSNEYLNDMTPESSDAEDGPSSIRHERTKSFHSEAVTDPEKPDTSSHLGPTLALAPYQFKMIQALDDVGFRKYPVFIHKVKHSHAAIIVRVNKSSFDEGRIVLKHWLDEEFIL
ncbi:lipid particle protein [Rutstroemia sp. NJR-2017a BBW]|nr:lipid particle protein [Rutstroemia sp. NJR-2017a BBW]